MFEHSTFVCALSCVGVSSEEMAVTCDRVISEGELMNEGE